MNGVMPQVIWHTAAPVAVWHTALEEITQYAICIFNGLLQHSVDILKISIKRVIEMLRMFSILHNRKPQN
jgi:hypothetical protein